MAQRVITIGAAPDDHAGDHIRDVFYKVNVNMTELYDATPIAGPIFGFGYMKTIQDRYPLVAFTNGTQVASDYVCPGETQTPRALFFACNERTGTAQIFPAYRAQVATDVDFTTVVGDAIASASSVHVPVNTPLDVNVWSRLNGSVPNTTVCDMPLIVRTPANLATVNVGSSPRGGCYDPVRDRLYVCNLSGNSVSVFDATNESLITTIAIGSSGAGNAVYCPYNDKIYVAHGSNTSMSVVDPVTNTVSTTITSLGGQSIGIAYSPRSNIVAVSCLTSSTIEFIRVEDNVRVERFLTGASPRDVCYCPIDNSFWVTSATAALVYKFDATRLRFLGSVTVGSSPHGVGFCPTTGKIYVVNNGGNTVSVVDPTTILVTNTITGSMNGPVSIAFCPTTNRMYVASNGNDLAVTIDPFTELVDQTVAAGDGPYGVFNSPVLDRMYVCNSNVSTISALS